MYLIKIKCFDYILINFFTKLGQNSLYCSNNERYVHLRIKLNYEQF